MVFMHDIFHDNQSLSHALSFHLPQHPAAEVQIVIENPANSWLFRFPPLAAALEAVRADHIETHLGPFGMKIQKKIGLSYTANWVQAGPFKRMPP